ncbi:hypothetical protein SAMN05443663_107139 [Flavobacterium defluvii]|uniref:Uncharacterized protein n=1 Tax=Flavobacterium defluvii TaxID=370979 RepID=A0A1M5SM82_9FLAO|nr:hypothetical protein SAMN05443663_107139 [Flavobacterium defluvii]
MYFKNNTPIFFRGMFKIKKQEHNLKNKFTIIHTIISHDKNSYKNNILKHFQN